MIKKSLLVVFCLLSVAICSFVFAADSEVTLDTSDVDSGFTVKDSVGAPVMSARGDGKVGIGTTSPGAKLDVRGDIHMGSDGSQYAVSSSNGIRIEACRINNNGTASIDPGSGLGESWIESVFRHHVGYVIVTLKAGVFSQVPVCQVTANNIDYTHTGVDVQSTTEIRVWTSELSPLGPLDLDFHMTCIGKP